MKEFNLSEKIQDLETYEKDNLLFLKAYGRKENINLLTMGDVKEFIKRRIERIKLIIKLYPHKQGEELAGQLIEDLINDAGDKLI